MNGDNNNPDQNNPVNYQQPVAYDADGRPLYAAPPQFQQEPPQRIVHVSRAIEPVEVQVTPEVKAKHERSVKDFPTLNLSEHEYIISAVPRHPIGLVAPILITSFLVAMMMFFMLFFPSMAENLGPQLIELYPLVIIICVAFMALFLIAGYIAISIFHNNRFFLTNESVIQEIQHSVFSKKEQTVSLANIEDASYTQRGILQTMFDYGSIRLSTEGDETTYRFDYVANPKKHIGILNNAVEAFKNGRAIEDN